MKGENRNIPGCSLNVFQRIGERMRLQLGYYGLFLSVPILLLLAVTSLSANAEDIYDKILKPVYVTIITSPEVQEQLMKVDSQEQIQLEQTIKAGNRFIQLRFNGDDRYFADDPVGEDEWNKNLAPLLTMSGEDWEEYRENRWKIVDGNRKNGAHYLVACPSIGLVAINKSADGWTLVYRAKLIGSFPDLKAREILQVDKARTGKPYELQLNIGDQNRIVSEYSSEKFLAVSSYNYISHLRFEEQQNKSALESYKDSSISIINKKKSETLSNSRYKNIQSIKKQLNSAISACTNHGI